MSDFPRDAFEASLVEPITMDEVLKVAAALWPAQGEQRYRNTFDWLTSNFSSDVDYTGAEVIGRLRALEHALLDPHPDGVAGCLICQNDPEGFE